MVGGEDGSGTEMGSETEGDSASAFKGCASQILSRQYFGVGRGYGASQAGRFFKFRTYNRRETKVDI